MGQIDEMQAEIKSRHQKELDAFKSDDPQEEKRDDVVLNGLVQNMALNQDEEDDADDSDSAHGPKIKYEVRLRVSKAQKKREKKTQAAREKLLQINSEDVSHLSEFKLSESQKMSEIICKRGLEVFEVPPDGDCMFAAISHQLMTRAGVKYSVEDLRRMTSQHILDNRDSFVPFLINEDTGCMMADDKLEEYCQQIKSTKAWGGQLELRALSEVLQRPIEVVQATGPEVIIGDHLKPSEKKLLISYHRHSYTLGEHYNSLIDKS